MHAAKMGQKNHVVTISLVIGLSGFSTHLAAQYTLSPVAIYHRCYAQIVHQRPAANDPGLIAVRAGANPITECLEVLDRANLSANGNTRIANPADSMARAVIGGFQRLHASWFGNKDISVGNNTSPIATRNIYDVSSPAFYYTKALFTPGAALREVVTSTVNLRAVRTDQDPAISTALDDDRVVCWGDNEFGQADVPFLENPTAVAAGHQHTCALDRSGVVCWGSDEFGQADAPLLL